MLTKKDNTKSEVKNMKNGKNAHQEENHGCCQPQPTSLASSSIKDSHIHQKNSAKTCVTIKYNVGYPNQLYIRGKGANLSWEKGIPLKNTKPDEWVWETDAKFAECEFKVLINDRVYETGENHVLHGGATLLYTPRF